MKDTKLKIMAFKLKPQQIENVTIEDTKLQDIID
jgi:hypothetical protein